MVLKQPCIQWLARAWAGPGSKDRSRINGSAVIPRVVQRSARSASSGKACASSGWLHTGNLAHRDVDDYLWFVSRKKLMIVRRGSNIAPAEVENVLDEHPEIHASVVVGPADKRDGAVPVAVVATLDSADPPSETSLRAYMAQRLAAYKNPVHYIFMDELPRTGTGKFDRVAAADRCRAGGRT